MTEHDSPSSLVQSVRLLTRRRLLIASGGSAFGYLIAPAVLGHDDDDSDHDDDHGDDKDDDHDDSDRDDDEVRAIGEVPTGSTEVVIDDDDADGFEPGIVTIDVGSSVTWVNLDDDPHTATGAGFDTGIMQPGDLATITFDEPGSFPYSCQIHPVMVGTVEVRDENSDIPQSANTTQGTPAASPQASPASGAGERATVDIENVAFAPESLSVGIGTTVTWTNREAIPHTVTADDGSFDSGTLNQGDTFEFWFGSAGTFEYACAIHPGMRGSIVVTE